MTVVSVVWCVYVLCVLRISVVYMCMVYIYGVCLCCVYVLSCNSPHTIFPYKCTSPNYPIKIPHTNPPIQIGLAQLIVYCDQPSIQADALRLLDIPGGTLPAGTHQYHSNVRTITAKMLEKIRSAHPIGGHQVQ